MTIRDLVLEAGGLTEGAYLQEAEIARVPSDRSNGVTATTRRVALDSSYVADGPPPTGPGELLEPFDNVLIMQSPDYLPPRSVVVSGEVRFPGRYTLRTKSERLSDLLVRAGGPTTDADLGAAYFARAKALQSFQASEGRESVDSMVQKQQTVERGRVGVDLPVALRRPGSSDDLTLFAEDSLHVPFRRTTVEIEGAVNAPTAIASRRGASIDYYVRAAGGASITGDARRVYVIQPNGKIEAPRRIAGLIPVRPTPRPGSTVVVPARSTENRTQERIATAQLLTQLVTSIVTAYALLR
jgi:protein involved in polysaccharide export with SLBB domain